MSFDTKYRPMRYNEVLGQEKNVRVLRGYVKSGRGFNQSYLFAGGYGTGKTTLARILARSLLCESNVDGDPCDTCPTCLSFLKGNPESFVEFDAATNSGKAEVKKILEEVGYSTFSGRRRLYLLDEAHRLTKEALDSLLKSLEEDIPGKQEKKLICIFCTTEPEKMRNTILSRCAPMFLVQPSTEEEIVGRLSWVCEQESLEYEREALALMVRAADYHIRDTLKALEGVSLLGSVSVENAKAYLRLDIEDLILDLLGGIFSQDRKRAVEAVKLILRKMSASQIYQRVSLCLHQAYQKFLGISQKEKIFSEETLDEISKQGDRLLTYLSFFSSRPQYVTDSSLICDILMVAGEIPALPIGVSIEAQRPATSAPLKSIEISNQSSVTLDGAYINPDAFPQKEGKMYSLRDFMQELELWRDRWLEDIKRGSEGQHHVGSS